MLSLAGITAVIVAVALIIMTVARLGIAKNVRFGKGRHERAPHAPPQLAGFFEELDEDLEKLDLDRSGLYYVDDGDGRATVVLYAVDEEEEIWARFEPTESSSVPTQVSFQSLLEDGRVQVTVFPSADPLLPEHDSLVVTTRFFSTQKQALRAHRNAIHKKDVECVDVNDLLRRLQEIRGMTLTSWKKQGWMTEDGHLTLKGVLRAGEKIQRYAGAATKIEVKPAAPTSSEEE